MQAPPDHLPLADDPRLQALATPGETARDAQREREFRRASRHSRTVRWLKVGLPAIATVIVAAALVVTWAARRVPGDLAFASTSIQDGRLVMSDPRMSGVDGRDRPYSMLADRAIDTTKAQLNAAKGRYDTRSEVLRLYDDINVETTSGIRIKLASADVSLQNGTLTGSGPVEIATPNQRLEAGNVVISDRGKHISFRDRVKLTLLPTASNGAEAPSSEPRP